MDGRPEESIGGSDSISREAVSKLIASYLATVQHHLNKQLNQFLFDMPPTKVAVWFR